MMCTVAGKETPHSREYYKGAEMALLQSDFDILDGT
jgi:hypothetical protein